MRHELVPWVKLAYHSAQTYHSQSHHEGWVQIMCQALLKRGGFLQRGYPTMDGLQRKILYKGGFKHNSTWKSCNYPRQEMIQSTHAAALKPRSRLAIDLNTLDPVTF